MKNGYMFFLNLGSITYMARILLFVVALIFVSVDGFFERMFILACIVVLIIISSIKAPSDKDVLRGIEFFRQRFKEKIKESGHTYSMQNVKVIEAYKLKGKMKMRRMVGRDIIYPHLFSIALAPSDKGKLMLYADELCLLKKGDPSFCECLVDISAIEISSCIDDDDADVVYIELKCKDCKALDEGVSLVAKNDFHYREFIEMLSA